jgi:hypothetical protein
LGGEEEPEPEIVELQTKTALVFIVTSSLVLLFLFYFRSIWSAWLLVFLFCVGGLQVPAQPGRKRLCLILYGFISFCSSVTLPNCFQGLHYVASTLIIRCGLWLNIPNQILCIVAPLI